MKAMRGTLQWVQDVEEMENARVMPKTNARGRAGRSAANVIGYVHPEASGRTTPSAEGSTSAS